MKKQKKKSRTVENFTFHRYFYDSAEPLSLHMQQLFRPFSFCLWLVKRKANRREIKNENLAHVPSAKCKYLHVSRTPPWCFTYHPPTRPSSISPPAATYARICKNNALFNLHKVKGNGTISFIRFHAPTRPISNINKPWQRHQQRSRISININISIISCTRSESLHNVSTWAAQRVPSRHPRRPS